MSDLIFFGSLDIKVPPGADVQRVRNTKMVPEELVQCRVFINPDDLVNRHNGVAVDGCLDEKMLGDEHVLSGELRQCGQALPPPDLTASSDCRKAQGPGQGR